MTAECLLYDSNYVCFFTCADGVMKFDQTATEDSIRTFTSEHLKHAAQRSGVGGFTPHSH